MEQSTIQLVNQIFDSIAGINQLKEEIFSLIRYISDENIKVFLEIGTQNGGTVSLFAQYMQKDSVSISIDIKPLEFKLTNEREIHLITADSREQKSINMVSEILNDRKVDMLLIDGDHTNARLDFETYSKFVRSGGIVLFHDINPKGPSHNVGTVPAFWNSIKSSYRYAEFVANNPDGFGIGLIHMP